MKILLIGNYLPSGEESMQRFAGLLQRGLSGAGHDVRLLKPAAVFGRIKPGESGLGKWLGYIDRFVLFPFKLRRAAAWADLIHICDHGNAVYVSSLKKKPHLVTCHDVLAVRSALGEVPQNRPRWTGRILQRRILRGLRQARQVVCNSAQSRTELLRVGGLSAEQVSVVPIALHYPFKPMCETDAARRLERIGCGGAGPYLLHVGSNIWYKNRDGALRIFHALRALPGGQNYRLVMAGKPWTGEMHDFVSRSGLQDFVVEVTGAGDEDLRALYSSAEALLFPSLEEGFGWPIIEAQACGCAVITTERPPMTEVGGEAAIYIDPGNEAQAAETILGHLPAASSRRQLGFENVKRFGKSRMIDGYLRAYRSVLGEPRRHEPPAPAANGTETKRGGPPKRQHSSNIGDAPGTASGNGHQHQSDRNDGQLAPLLDDLQDRS